MIINNYRETLTIQEYSDILIAFNNAAARNKKVFFPS